MSLFHEKIFVRLLIYFVLSALIPLAACCLFAGVPLRSLLVPALAGAGVGLLLAVFFARDIARPIHQLETLMGRIATKDLTLHTAVLRRDEWARVEEAFAGMLENLRGTFRDLQAIFGVNASSVDHILGITSEQSKWITEQSSSITEISATMGELNASAQLVHERADFLFKQGQEAIGKSREGQGALEASTKFMEDIRSKVQEIGQRIMSLSEQAHAIDQIIATVSDIAEKTDILAINAAIEAVKAGEYGKGFGVVAVEIRKLADQSKKASAKIVSRVREIQAATNNTVMAAEEGEKSVNRGVELIEHAGDVVITAMKTFQETVNLSNEIRLASREQSVATSQVAEGTHIISQSIQKMEASFKEALASIRLLSDQVRKVDHLMGAYTL